MEMAKASHFTFRFQGRQRRFEPGCQFPNGASRFGNFDKLEAENFLL